MTDLAPWESPGDGKQPFHPDAPTKKVPQAPKRLPEIYKAQTQAFIATSGHTVPQPQATPRPLEPRAKTALMALGAAVLAGLFWAGVVFLIFDAEAGALRFIYAGIGLLVSAVAGIVLILEMPRISAYKNANFVPGVLVYGSRAIVEKVVGPVGIGSINTMQIRGTGSGILSKVFDRSSHKSTPPEIVALHINLAGGPQLVGVEWSAVHEFQRGDIVWFQPKGPTQYLMFHKLIPYAPWVSADKQVKQHLFTELGVGQIKYQDRQGTQNMGTTKAFKTDRDGNLVAADAPTKKTPKAESKDSGRTAMLGLTSQGGALGGDEQFDQSMDEYSVDQNQRTGKTNQYRISDPEKPLGGTQQPSQGDTYE